MVGINSLIVLAFVNAIITILLYYIDKNMLSHRRIGYRTSQIVFGIIFGVIAIFGTEKGVQISGAVMNIRDTAPLCAGLFFGPLSGVIAGFIGGIERWFAVYWGAGTFTRLACTLGTIVAGLLGAFVKKYLFEGRVPGPLFALGIGAVAEVFHMLMLYITNGNEAEKAHTVLLTCAPVMIPMVAVATALPAFVICIVDGNRFRWRKNERTIAQNIALGIVCCIIIALFMTTTFQIQLQTKLAMQSSNSAVLATLSDVRSDMERAEADGETDMETFLKGDLQWWHIGKTGFLWAANAEGRIIASTDGAIPTDKRDASKVIGSIASHRENKTYKTEFDGVGYYYAYQHIGDFYVCGMYPVSEAEFVKSVSVVLSGLLEIIVFAVVFMLIFILVRLSVIKQLNQINSDLEAISNGGLDTVVNVYDSLEFGFLSEHINETVDSLKSYIAAAAAKVEEELRIAKKIQRSALPTAYPDDNRYELYANMLAAREVGGDFYDFYPVGGDDRIAFLIADVSGKGIPAAMFMMKAKSIIKTIIEGGASPGVAFTKANENLCADNEAEMFVTAFMGIMDMNTGHVVFANAGHNPPILKNKDGSLEYLKSKTGFVLAGMEGIQYEDQELDLDEGQSLFLYTDGVTEATDLNNELFGEDRLIKVIRESGNMNMRYTCKLVKQRVDEFVGAAPQFDDITMLGIKRKTAADREGSLVMMVTPNSINQVLAFFDEYLEKHRLPMNLSAKISVIVDEIYSNIVNYSGATIAIVSAECDRNKFIMSFQDNGVYYDPLAKEDPDITLSAEERNIGGLGIYMVKKMSNDVKYTRVAGKNILDVVIDIGDN